jgi:bisphosphoglycerate-independent phosphoglycerate mutase (AlkP superfamily)
MQVNVPRHPVVLRILDGSGINPSRIGNAVAQAHLPPLRRWHFRHNRYEISLV